MPSADDIHDQYEQLKTCRARLAHNLKRISYFSDAEIPYFLSADTANARACIKRCKENLCQWGVEVEDHPNDDDGDEEFSGYNRPFLPERQAHATSPTFTQWWKHHIYHLLLLLVLSIAAIASIIAWIAPSSPPPRMTGDLRIVILPFLDAAAATELTQEDIATYTTDLVANIRTTLAAELAMDTTTSVMLWGPHELAAAGINEQMYNDPYMLAHTIQANILVTGKVHRESHTGDLVLSLGMHILDVPFADAAEVLGSYDLGVPLRYVDPATPGPDLTDDMLQQQLAVMATLLLGLEQVMGPPALTSLETAQAYFEQAHQRVRQRGTATSTHPTDCPPLFTPPRTTGEAVSPRVEATIRVLQGNTYARMAEYQAARRMYEEAIVLACDYARPYLGMAVLLTRQAAVTYPATDTDQRESLESSASEALLDEAATYFTWAEQARWRPENALFEERITYGYAEWHLTRAMLQSVNQPTELAAAHQYYTRVIDRFNEPRPTPFHILQMLAASAYANRAFITAISAPPQAVHDYQTAIALSDDAEQQAFWMAQLGQVYATMGDCDTAHHTLVQARDQMTTALERERIEAMIHDVMDRCTPVATPAYQDG